MFWNRLISVMLGGGMIMARPLRGGEAAPVRLPELLSYECARVVAGLRPAGPLFRERDLIFASYATTGERPELMLSSGAGLFALELAHQGINRLRFELADAVGRHQVTYYLTYLHDERLGSRYLEFAINEPPLGHFDIDYLAVVPRRADHLVPQLDYATFLTSANSRRSNGAGATAGLARQDLNEACGHLRRENPTLARGLFANFEDLTVSAARLPASLR
jgi:hypothetical protein